MYVRTVKNNQGKEYLRIVESYRENGKNKQKIIANLGRIDTISRKEVENIVDKLVQIYDIKGYVNLNSVEEAPDKKNYGIKVIVDRLFERYEMDKFFEKMDKKTRFDVEDLLKIMVMNRIIEPKSKLGIFNELDYYGFKRKRPEGGSRMEEAETDEEGIALQWMYRTLDVLAQKKEELEKHLYRQRMSLFNSVVDLVFYDVTTLAFETLQTNELLQMGYSKDKKFNESQVVLGMSIDRDRMPVSFDIYPGNTFEGHTFKDTIEAMKKRYQLGKVIVVSDRGMMSKTNMEIVENSDYEFIVGKSIKQLKKVDIFDGGFTEIAKGIEYREIEYEGKRLLIIHSKERAEKDRKDRIRLIEKAKKMLKDGNIETKSKRGAKKYLKTKNEVDYTLDIQKIEKDEKYDGYYGIITNTQLNPKQILEQYHTLWKVEESFRTLKNYLETRPIFHWTQKRIKGHIVMSFVSYIMQRTLELELERNNIEYSHEKIREAIKNMEYIDIKPNEQHFAIRTNMNLLAQKILKILNIPIPKVVTPYEEFIEKLKLQNENKEIKGLERSKVKA
ncbi:IS1634 family transposase [Petrotoga sp. Shatin.DS.tank11.9.2.9.3]|uniref:IS1634 family transposase n=1 Tax=Petrotoga sp. Shatin.DS.tank11.9.2.9.3 TaxID=1469556 RepID=UPI001314E582|nr:IS1634 family transposase [Petrotoga sp. Shatin.DS.tank11.9.2.9.3]